MILFDREKQCRDCENECGWDEARERLEDGTLLYNHFYDCKLGNCCSTDTDCLDYKEVK